MSETTQRPFPVAIVGTAGRRPHGDRMTKTLFATMKLKATELLREFDAPVELVSGGAAWSDHLAVQLFLEGRVAGLKLFLPCDWAGNGFVDTGSADWRTNPGKTSNYYHRQFSRVCGFDSLREIEQARQAGAILDSTKKGFHQRNTDVARSARVLIAFTWSETDQPADGGTLDTWQKCLPTVRKIHVSLAPLAVPLVGPFAR